jgi:internalin A
MAGDYDEAEREIAEAKASGATELSLICVDIGRLPESLSTLTGLQQLSVYDSMALPVAPRDLPLTWWPALKTLHANRLVGAPVELGSENPHDDNCLPRIQAWHRDLATGIAPNADLKLFVLGNGRVGKTQICRRLKGEGFDASVPSTHGISLGQTRLIDGDAEANPPEQAVDLRFWDFGGQDVYLGTHALFLDDRAVYVIAWTPRHENTDECEENGVPMRNRPLRYWLEYVRSLAGPKAPVIVVQTQCDRERDVSSAPPILAEHGFERLRIADCSAKNRNGMARLTLELESAARYQLERYGEVQLPANWVAVGDDLRRMRDEQGIRTLPRDEFERLCAEQHQTAVPGVVLEYLHRSGQVFWKQGVFGDQVVLDQAWALDGMYAVLHRDSALPLIRERHGRFSPLLLEKLVWQNRTAEERKLFLSMMEKCQTCFKIAEDTYVAPALLPLESAVAGQIAGLWQGAEAQAEVKLNYAFLHEGVLRALLCGIGSRAGVQAVYWRYGVCFYDQKAAGVVRIRSELPDPSGQGGGWISVETTGANAAALAREVVGSIERINIGAKPDVVWRDEAPAGLSSREVEPAEPFAALQPGPPPLALGEPRPVYVSYAWGGESERLVDDLEGLLLHRGCVLRRDKRELRPGHWISEFEREIARADRVIVVLSPKYLESIYCMQELIHLYAQVLGDRVRLQEDAGQRRAHRRLHPATALGLRRHPEEGGHHPWVDRRRADAPWRGRH